MVGERFRMKVGLKCAHECDLANSRFEIQDHEGARAATGTLSGEVWPGTTGLYVAEVELTAPPAEGLYTWRVNGPAVDGETPHAPGAVSFGIRVVTRPEFLVTIAAVDAESQAPLEGARVVMHPYKAVANEQGVAEVRVAKGTYRLFVSRPRYVTFGLSIDVTADVATRAELCVEPVTERN